MVVFDTNGQRVKVADPALGIRRIPRSEWDEQWSGYCAFASPTPDLESAAPPRPVWEWLVEYLRPFRKPLGAALVLAVIAAALEMSIPVLAGRIIDQAVSRHDRNLVSVLGLAMLGVLGGAVVATLWQRWLLARMAVRFDAATLHHVTTRLLALPLSYFAKRRTGDIQRRLSGMRQVRIYLVQEGLLAVTAAAQVVVALAVMLSYSVTLTGVYAATLPLLAASMVYSKARLRPLLGSLEEAFGKYYSRQIDAVKAIDTVKSAGAEDGLGELIRRQFTELAGRVWRADRAFLFYDAGVQMITFLGLVAVLWVGGLMVIDGRLTVGDLLAFNGLVVLASGPTTVVMRVWDELQQAAVLLGRVDDMLAATPEQGHDRSALKPVPSLGGRVTLEGVGLSLGESGHTVEILADVSLDVAPGETVAIVGRSGAGKTTLVRCLTGLIEPTSGRICYDGVDLTTLDYRELRRRVGCVLQDARLLDDTIAANIALGAELDMGAVRWAAQVATADEFIRRLPLGYETMVGETGLRLSGGQVQRIAVARAVYGRPPVLILDEATSALDTDSERALKDSLAGLLAGCTAFVIAHRLSTVRDADRVVVLEGGRIAEVGSHDELVARRGLYWYLISQQLEI